MAERHPTAGFRNAGWTMDQLPEGASVSVHALRTSDNAAVKWVSLHIRAFQMPPPASCIRENSWPPITSCRSYCRRIFRVHADIPLGKGPDLRLEHEIALLDVAAGLNFLKHAGFRTGKF